MPRFIHYMFVVACLFVATACNGDEKDVDALMRSKVDALNKSAFMQRYDYAQRSEMIARRALRYIDDSLPSYYDGKLRSWNIIATSFFNRSVHDSAEAYADSVLAYTRKSPNSEVEKMLANLLKSRLLQRKCDIAGSYQILYDIEQSGLLKHNGKGWLYNLAQSEFYITTTTLNYHYRNKSQYQQAELLTAMENRRHELRCDYHQDMSFNYAIAYGYHSLCTDSIDQTLYVGKVLDYCVENLRLLDDSTRYSAYHLANTYQLLGFMLWNGRINMEALQNNNDRLMQICDLVFDAFGFDVVQDDTSTVADRTRYDQMAYAFLREATALFFQHGDAYQKLGSIVATGRFCLAHGDTATARSYFTEALIDSSMLNVAPKFEAMLYEGFLTSQCASSLNVVADWTRHELQLLSYISQNEKADFVLQQQLSKARRGSLAYMIFSIVLLVLAIALFVTLLLLRRRTRALGRETAQLQAAKRQDVERIANVETCLSVLRHDITPFISYLQNEKLPDDLKREVTGQLIRTFENIKSWTNLSIPSGLQFNRGVVALGDVFDNVRQSVGNFRGADLAVSFCPTDLSIVGDKQLVEIMLRNIVNNAIQHTEKGSVSVYAQPFESDSRFVEVAIKDTGSGMDSETLENLFRADKKIKPSTDRAYGTGFGLILCRYIIKKHDDNTLRGCRIWAESSPAAGTTFHFLLQRAEHQST